MNDDSNALISIKPPHADKITRGLKTVELRTRRPNIPPGSRIWIYVTKPTAALAASAQLLDVASGTPTSIWRSFGPLTGISKQEFDIYFEGRPEAYALLLNDVKILSRPLSLKRMRQLVKNFHPPQFFTWLNGTASRMRLTKRKSRSICSNKSKKNSSTAIPLDDWINV